MKILFLRKTTAIDTWDFYEAKTDVFVIGDTQGFRYVVRSVKRVLQTTACARLATCETTDNSMRVLILPAQRTRGQRPRLKFIERVTADNNRLNMELVIVGNASGYKYLVEVFDGLIRTAGTQATDHVDLNEWGDSAIEGGSVSLNVRTPVRSFTQDALAELAPLVLQQNETLLPEGVSDYHDAADEYEIPSPTTSAHVRLRGFVSRPQSPPTLRR